MLQFDFIYSYATGWQLLYAVYGGGFARARLSFVIPVLGPAMEYAAFP